MLAPVLALAECSRCSVYPMYLNQHPGCSQSPGAPSSATPAAIAGLQEQLAKLAEQDEDAERLTGRLAARLAALRDKAAGLEALQAQKKALEEQVGGGEEEAGGFLGGSGCWVAQAAACKEG
jgi:hypothetical protein